MTQDEQEYFSQIYDENIKELYGISLIYLKNKEDAEDAVTDSFLKFMQSKKTFANDEHRKAYLIRICINVCKDVIKSSWKKNTVLNEDAMLYLSTDEEKGIMEEILALPAKYRIVIYMHYYQGYTAKEISEILKINISAVLSRLSRGRKKLKILITEGGTLYG